MSCSRLLFSCLSRSVCSLILDCPVGTVLETLKGPLMGIAVQISLKYSFNLAEVLLDTF